MTEYYKKYSGMSCLPLLKLGVMQCHCTKNNKSVISVSTIRPNFHQIFGLLRRSTVSFLAAAYCNRLIAITFAKHIGLLWVSAGHNVLWSDWFAVQQCLFGGSLAFGPHVHQS